MIRQSEHLQRTSSSHDETGTVKETESYEELVDKLKALVNDLDEFCRVVYVYDSGLQNASLKFADFIALEDATRTSLVLGEDVDESNIVSRFRDRTSGWTQRFVNFVADRLAVQSPAAVLRLLKQPHHPDLNVTQEQVAALAASTILAYNVMPIESGSRKPGSLQMSHVADVAESDIRAAHQLLEELAQLTDSPLHYITLIKASEISWAHHQSRPIAFFESCSSKQAKALIVSILHAHENPVIQNGKHCALIVSSHLHIVNRSRVCGHRCGCWHEGEF